MKRGHIYILINAAMPGYLKIGKTERSSEHRAKELSCVSGIPSPFVVAYEVLVRDCCEAERVIHKELAKYRINDDREFFAIALKKAIAQVSDIAGRYPVRGPGKQTIRETLLEVEDLLRRSRPTD